MSDDKAPADHAGAAALRRADPDCASCGARLREGAMFCASCGAPAAAPGAAAAPAPAIEAPTDRPAEPRPDTAAEDAPRATPAAATPSIPITQSFLLPRFPFSLLWSPRRSWGVTTRLSEREVTDLFTETMTRQPSLLRRSGNYFRRVRWNVDRNAISGEVIATCVPDGLVQVGFGRHKRLVDVTGDAIVCSAARASGASRTEASVGVDRYTTLWGFYLYPATVYPFDVVKAVKRADRDAAIAYPWSIARMIAVALTIIFFIAVSASGGGSPSSYDGTAGGPAPSVDAGSPGSPAPPADEPEAPVADPPVDEEPVDEEPVEEEPVDEAPVIDVPATPTVDDPSRLAAEVNAAIAVIGDASASEDDIAAAGRLEQLATRAVSLDRDLRAATFDELDLPARRTLAATTRAANALSVVVEPQEAFPDWRIVPPASAERLRDYYRTAEAVFGIEWQYFAAIHLVETRLGRIRGASTAGARGPMQFLPATWRRYGEGDINNTRDSIMAAGRLLVANGAPGNMAVALYRYNPSRDYVRAIEEYSDLMRDDPRAFFGLHGWQVFYKHVDGTHILPVGYPDVEPEPIED
jgi:hypothetical protein